VSALVHIRVVVPAALRDAVVAALSDNVSVTNIIVLADAVIHPNGDLVLFDVARESINHTVAELESLGVREHGSITVVHTHLSLGQRIDVLRDVAPGEGHATVVWPEIETIVRADARMSWLYLTYFLTAAVIAAAGIMSDSSILIVGAMVVGPEFAPLAAMSWALERRDWSLFAQAALTGAVGSALAVAGAALITLVVEAAGWVPQGFDMGDLPLTGFISHPDVFTLIVAAAAAVAGMLALTLERSGTLVGVLVSVTTIPAIAGIGVAAATAEWDDVRGASLQLAINLAALTVVGAITLAVLRRRTPRAHRPTAV
jgi:uncharacterized hydrophobic protein (TIGR00271 family)